MADPLDDLADDLDAYMAGLDEAPPGDEPPPVPRDADEANQMLRRIARFKREAARVHAAADAEFARVQAWLTDRLSGIDRQLEFHERSLEAWMRAQYRERPSTKTYKLPAGQVAVRAGRVLVAVSTRDSAVDEVRAEHPEWVRERFEVSKADVTLAVGAAMTEEDAIAYGFEPAPLGYTLCWAIDADGVASTAIALLSPDPDYPKFNYQTKETP